MIERYNFQERFVHWVAGVSYLYLMLTGFAFYTPHLYWIAQVLGGGPTSRFWHPILGLAFCCTTWWMWSKWRADMRMTDLDRKWQENLKAYVTHDEEHVPAAGRFNAGQKQFFWIMFLGGLALLLSGLVLWFTDSLPWSLRWLRYLSVLVHVIAFLATVAGFIVHVYMGVFVVPGGTSAITTGQVSRAWARTHHRLWYEEQTK
jgi:formate dehydrogenase subunit gamma